MIYTGKNFTVILLSTPVLCYIIYSAIWWNISERVILMNKFNSRELCPGVYLNSVPDGRFKTGKILVDMYLPLIEDTAAENALLIQLLGRCCERCPDYLSLNREMNSLYGALLSTSCSKIGDFQQLSLSISALDDRYTLFGEKLSGKLIGLLCDLIFRPRLEGEAFVSEDVEQERRKLLETIQAEINEKRSYAISQCVKLLCEGDKVAVDKYGSAEAVSALTPEQLYKAWINLKQRALFNITVVGELDVDFIGESFKAEIEKSPRQPYDKKITPLVAADEIKEKTERQKVMQSKLVMGFSLDNKNNTRYSLKLMTLVLGGTPSSKLFLNVREKKSLCYYCAANNNSHKGYLLVDSGVEKQNIEQTREEILNQINEMKNGNITDFEIEAAKLAMAQTCGMITDSIGAMADFFAYQFFDDEILTPEQRAEAIASVTKDEIVKAANSVELKAVYILTGDDEEGEQQ